jgi:hypothetical protein
MKRTYSFSKIILGTFFIFLGGSISKVIPDDTIHISLSDTDLKIIENGDCNSASVMLYKMRRIYDKNGKDPIIPAIPALIKRAHVDLKIDIDECEGELFGEVIWALSIIGDKRVEPVLFEIMLCPKIFTWDVPLGFLRIGKSTFPSLLNYLYSINDSTNNVSISTKLNILVTLRKMGEFDSTGTYFTENDKKVIKQEILKTIKNKDENIRKVSVMALGVFGDQSTIPILDEIKKSDPYLVNGKYFIVRMEAEKAINKIMKK